MRTVTRHVVWELLKVFSLALAGLTLLFLAVLILAEARRMNLGPGPILQIMQYVLPMALTFAIPASILFAVCYVYGRMSADNEIVAIKSLGISPTAVLWPGFALAFVLSGVAVWVNDVAYSWGLPGMQRVVLQSVEEIAYRLLRSQKSYSNQNFSIVVRDVQGRTLIRPIITVQKGADVPPCTLTAARSEVSSNLERGTLRLYLSDYEVDLGDGIIAKDSGTMVYEVPLSYASAKEQTLNSPQQVPMYSIDSEIDKQRQEISIREQGMAAEAGFDLLMGDFDELKEEQWQGKRKQLTDARNRLYRLQTEPWRRWASGFSCLCFVLVGAPLAVLLRNADYVTTFFACFLPILVGYYPLLMYGIDQAKAGHLPPYVVWLANLACVGVGLVIMRQVRRY